MAHDNAAPAVAPLHRELTGRQRIRAMLMAQGLSLAAWARLRGIVHREQLHAMLSGRREYPEIRDLLSADLGITREELDAMIPEPERKSA